MVKIYGLFTDELCWYVGSTIDVKARERQHRSRRNRGRGADLIPLEYAWQFRVLEDCPLEARLQRERHWYDTLHPLYNQQVPGRTKKESDAAWHAANREQENERSRLWAAANREKVKEARRRYRVANRDKVNARYRLWYAKKRAAAAAQPPAPLSPEPVV
jgi:hypothetical protein